MNFQIDVSSPVNPPPPPPANPALEQVDLLRQILELQKQQVGLLQALAAAHDHGARWRAFLNRWREDFPNLANNCKQVVPQLERTYGKLIAELTEHLQQNGEDFLENDFGLQDFLDRYGIRLAQLGSILNMVAPLADAGSPSESA